MAVAVRPESAAREVVAGHKREWPLALLMLAPSLAIFGVFVFYPLIRTVQLGFYKSDPFGNTRYAGAEQYRDVLTSEEFRNSLKVTFEFAAITVPLGLALGIGLAVLAHQRLRGVQIYRTIFSSTVATSVAVASLMWLTLLNPSIGLVNQLLEDVDRGPILFTQTKPWALWSVALATVWQHLGFTFIIMSAGLQAIPDELLESAQIDGAGPWRRFREVTLPLLSPTALFAFVVLSINAFQTFGQIDLLTRGGPLKSTNVMVYSIFQRVSSDPGVASAQAVVLFLILLALTIFQLRVLERRVFYGS